MPNKPHESDTSSFVLLRSGRKTLSLKVKTDLSLEVRAPYSVAEAEILNFVRRHEKWIEKARKRVAERADRESPEKIPAEGEPVLLFGKSYTLSLHAAERSSSRLHGGKIELGLRDPEDSAAIRKALNSFYRKRAEPAFSDALDRCLAAVREQIKIKRPELKIRAMRSRWGVCAPSKGRITLSLYLAQFPEKVVELVIFHELCHFKHRAHDKTFYAFLSRFVPDYKELGRILRDSGIEPTT